MTKTVTTVAVALLFTSPAQAVRIWFSLSGAPENQPISGTPSEYFLQKNPVIDAGAGGTARLYVWGSHEDWAHYRSVHLDVNLYPQVGGISIVDSRFYNYFGELFPGTWRWDYIDQGILTPTKLEEAAMYGGSPYSWCFGYLAAYYGDIQYDAQTRSMLLGYVDLEMTAGAQGEVFFGTGLGGFTSQPPIFEAFYGWGDPAVPLYPWGQQSTLPDAYIVPEPATAGLLLCVAPVLLRRRRTSRARRRPASSR